MLHRKSTRYRTPPLLRAVFKKNGQPRPWFFARAFAPDFTPRPWTRVLAPMRWWQRACDQFLPRTGALRQAQRAQNATRLQQGFGSHPLRICILSPPQTTYVARFLAALFTRLGFDAAISDTYDDNSFDLYIVFSLFAWATLPPPERRIAFQVEQRTQVQYFTDHYLDQLNASLAVFDYSQENISHLKARRPGWLKPDEPLIDRLYYVPISPLKIPVPSPAPTREGVLFYGALTPHRRTVLQALAPRHKIRVEDGLYGKALDEALWSAKVVLNLHRSREALLETTRICESLSYGARVVSESVLNLGEFPELDGQITYAPAGDTQALADALDQELAKQPRSPEALDALNLQSERALVHALYDLGLQVSTSQHP